MAEFKVGQRVRVKEGVSNRKDAGSVTFSTPNGIDRSHLVGKRGEIVEINEEGQLLVDSQIKEGVPVGKIEMREWFDPDELEHG